MVIVIRVVDRLKDKIVLGAVLAIVRILLVIVGTIIDVKAVPAKTKVCGGEDCEYPSRCQQHRRTSQLPKLRLEQPRRHKMPGIPTTTVSCRMPVVRVHMVPMEAINHHPNKVAKFSNNNNITNSELRHNGMHNKRSTVNHSSSSSSSSSNNVSQTSNSKAVHCVVVLFLVVVLWEDNLNSQQHNLNSPSKHNNLANHNSNSNHGVLALVGHCCKLYPNNPHNPHNRPNPNSVNQWVNNCNNNNNNNPTRANNQRNLNSPLSNSVN